jgi:hypothetical protein
MTPEEALNIKRFWFDHLDALPPEWRALSKEYPDWEEIIEMYIGRVPLPHAKKLLQDDMERWCRTKWPTYYPDIKPFYDARMKEPYK